MFKAPKSKHLVPYDGSFRVADAPTDPGKGKWRSKLRLGKAIVKLDGLQKALYAHDRHAVLLVFQAMDAGGKDSMIRAVMEGINPAGCQVFSSRAATTWIMIFCGAPLAACRNVAVSEYSTAVTTKKY
jgi:polyphosphate kinase 2 (PPK2 family)